MINAVVVAMTVAVVVAMTVAVVGDAMTDHVVITMRTSLRTKL
jgi:hypothetical protein